jgi:WD40 repeat protein
VLSVALSPDGKILASGTLEENIILWEMATGRTMGEPLARHDSAVLSLAFSPDGKTLASASQDKTILLWNLTEKSWLTRTYHNLTQEWRRRAADLQHLKTSQGPKNFEEKTDVAGK